MHKPLKNFDSLPDSAPVRLVDVATVAAAMGQAKSSIYRMARAGLIPFYPAGPQLSGLRFDLSEVRAALKALAQQAVKP